MPSAHFPNSALRTTRHLLLLPSATLSSAAFTRPTPFRSHCLCERSHSSVRSRTWTPGPAHHFLAASVARLAVSVHTPSQLVSHLGERFRITSPDSHRNSSSRSQSCLRGRSRRQHADIAPSISSCRIIAPPDTSLHPMEANSSAMIALTPFPPYPIRCLNPTPLVSVLSASLAQTCIISAFLCFLCFLFLAQNSKS